MIVPASQTPSLWRGRANAIARQLRRAEAPEPLEELNEIAGAFPTANRAGRCDGRAPEGTSGGPAKDEHETAANARLPAQPLDAELEALLEDGLPDETDPDLDRGDDDAAELEPDDVLESFEIRRAPAPDYARYAEAMRAKARPAAAAVRVLEPAPSREECGRCGIPGFKGCAHQAPYQHDFVPLPDSRSRPRGAYRPSAGGRTC